MRTYSKEEILANEFITKTEIMRLFKIGEKKAADIFKKVEQSAIDDGKMNIPGRISTRRLCRMMGIPQPNKYKGADAVQAPFTRYRAN